METESIHPPGASTGPLRRAPLAHVFAPFVPLGGHRNCGSQVEGSDVPVSVRQRFPGGDCPPTAIEISSWPRRNQRWWGERTREPGPKVGPTRGYARPTKSRFGKDWVLFQWQWTAPSPSGLPLRSCPGTRRGARFAWGGAAAAAGDGGTGPGTGKVAVPASGGTVPACAPIVPASAETISASAEIIPASAEIVSASGEMARTSADTILASAEIIPASGVIVSASAETVPPSAFGAFPTAKTPGNHFPTLFWHENRRRRRRLPLPRPQPPLGQPPPPKRLKYPALALWPLFPYHNLLW